MHACFRKLLLVPPCKSLGFRVRHLGFLSFVFHTGFLRLNDILCPNFMQIWQAVWPQQQFVNIWSAILDFHGIFFEASFAELLTYFGQISSKSIERCGYNKDLSITCPPSWIFHFFFFYLFCKNFKYFSTEFQIYLTNRVTATCTFVWCVRHLEFFCLLVCYII